ncbi:MAG: VTT domain-containing protein [Eubacteriales bacterium]
MPPNKSAERQSIRQWAMLVFACILLVIGVYGYLRGWFSSVEALQHGIDELGLLGIVVFLLFQVVQVVFPLIPNQIISVAGVLIFDPFFGFIYNFIGVFVGSFLVFYLAQNFGMKVIEKLFSDDIIERYQHWTSHPKFVYTFAFAMICPGFPDDFLCYLAGTSRIKFTQFFAIILVGRAISSLTYSLFLDFFYSIPLS